MVGVDARIEAAFSEAAAAKFRRWAAGVLLDVFGSSDDLADTILTPQQRPRFRDASPSLTQFERFEHYDAPQLLMFFCRTEILSSPTGPKAGQGPEGTARQESFH